MATSMQDVPTLDPITEIGADSLNVAGSRYSTSKTGNSNHPIQEHDDYLSTITMTLEGDRTGNGAADFYIKYTSYANPNTGTPVTIPKGQMGLNFPGPGDDNLFFG